MTKTARKHWHRQAVKARERADAGTRQAEQPDRDACEGEETKKATVQRVPPKLAVGAPPPNDATVFDDEDPGKLPRPPPRPVFCTIDRWGELSGMSRRATYEAIARGDLIAIKRGSQTLIDCDHGFAWLRSLPRAQIKPRAQQKEVSM
jgi:hypothetical protein